MEKMAKEKERQTALKLLIKESVEQRNSTFAKLKKLTDRHLNIEKKIESCKMQQRNYIERISKAKISTRG